MIKSIMNLNVQKHFKFNNYAKNTKIEVEKYSRLNLVLVFFFTLIKIILRK
jgi:hypothetical protein